MGFRLFYRLVAERDSGGLRWRRPNGSGGWQSRTEQFVQSGSRSSGGAFLRRYQRGGARGNDRSLLRCRIEENGSVARYDRSFAKFPLASGEVPNAQGIRRRLGGGNS